MEFLQLKYFQTVAHLEHITKAAYQLQIAQPSLSKTIARLEEDLGVPLFDRQGRQIRLNEFGRAFLARVERAFMELNEGRREIRDLAGLNQGTVTLAVSIPRILPDLLGSFLAAYPKVHLRQYLESTASMKQQLENGEIDFCISSEPIESSDVVWQPLMTEEIFLVVPPDHRLAQRDSVVLSEVRDESFISMNAGYGFRHLTDRFCQQAGFTPNIFFAGDEPDVIGGLVRQGLGIAFVPALTWTAAAHRLPNKLRITDPVCERTIGLAWSNRRYLSVAAKQFHTFVVNYFKEISTDVVRH
ncbi:LysR family transcriptional regulator [Alicyclobacillus dauci]|uniref:LysR family transcriptional regulator n=1 Tax=Alicyclobacillus dauci TaxID=1475485 RepID=A0ABY6Z4Z2_9BACL|nr:LysR family transcriptional regulator [Alicyclobacillus dauci]WAH37593.1 LysR family transcriptional regulator [Alicyclobacillus dauci]